MMNEMNMRTILHNEKIFLNVCFFFFPFSTRFLGEEIKADSKTSNYDIKRRRQMLLIKTLNKVQVNRSYIIKILLTFLLRLPFLTFLDNLITSLFNFQL